MKETPLLQRTQGALVGSAIGDAMGGPVEFWSAADIVAQFGRVDRLLPYGSIEPSPHGPWTLDAGSCTDDTRMSRLLCSAALAAGRFPTAGDVRREFVRAYHEARTPLEKAFLEEYAFKALYGDEKQVFGGQPTNAGVMAVAPLGILAACDPDRALNDAYAALFYVEGYARHSAALAAAAVSAAMKPGTSVERVVSDALEAMRKHKAPVEGPLWSRDPMYGWIGRKSEELVLEACAVAKEQGASPDFHERLLSVVAQPFGSDGAETLAIGLALFTAAEGDFRGTVERCVAFGRDNDSSASFGGALAGALHGIDGIPAEWVAQVERANPPPSLESLAEGLCAIVLKDRDSAARVLESLDALL